MLEKTRRRIRVRFTATEEKNEKGQSLLDKDEPSDDKTYACPAT
jgi:hypothetical protein